MLYVKLAWRNLFRNKRRTFIAGTAIAIGLASMMIGDAIMRGMSSNMIAAATATYTGEAQIHAPGFRDTHAVDLTIPDSAATLAAAERDGRIRHAAPRAIGFGMITSARNVNQVLLCGVDPAREVHLSQFHLVLQAGRYLSGADDQGIVIGSKLAELLEVGVGDRVVVTAAQAGSGALSQELVRISGIFHFNVAEMDGAIILLPIAKAQRLMAIGSAFHEIALTLSDNRLALASADPFWRDWNGNGRETVPWGVLFPQLKAALNIADLSMIILGVILFAIISLGIINTLFMSIYERMFEFGVIRAVGTRPWGIRRLVIFEAGAMGILSVLMGLVLGTVINLFLARHGLDYRGLEYIGVSIRELIYPEITAGQYLIYPALVFAFTALVGTYPAFYAARMSLTRAMRRTM
jgi:ABC-type lipoprotein release transport system permease subunit